MIKIFYKSAVFLYVLNIGYILFGIAIEDKEKEFYRPEFSTAGFYQTETDIREAINFNVGWRFYKGDVLDAYTHDFNDSDWPVVNLPHGLEILPLSASGGANYQGPAWYRKHFFFEEQLKGKKIFIHFEGIMGKSKIWINGKLIAENFSGYLPIHLDITDFVNCGKDNLISVRADNSNDPDFPPGKKQETLDFAYFGGIYRDVWLVTHNDIYITNPIAEDKVAGGGIFIHYEDLSEDSARVLIDADICNEGFGRSVELNIKLINSSGNVIIEDSNSEHCPKNTSIISSFDLLVENPKLWSPDYPYRYDLLVEIVDESGNCLDSLSKKIGLRTIEMKGKDGLYLNGKPYPNLLIGANRHQDFAHIGNALPNNLHYRDALKLRQAGMRVIRSAHYVQDPAFMDACDELGLLFVSTIPGWQFWNDKPIFEQRMLDDIRKMIRLERNRPSILLWEVVPNETKFPNSFADKAVTTAKEEFPYKGIYTASDARTHRGNNQHFFDVLYADDTIWKYENKSVFKREWGDFVDNWVDHNSVSRVAKQWGEVPQIKQALHYFIEEWDDKGKHFKWPSLTKAYESSRSLIGATMWHPFDHQRGYHPDPFWGGIMDAYRQPKFSYFLFKSLLPTEGLDTVPLVEAEPFVYIAHLMTPFSPKDVVIFTNCEEVRLSLYGDSLGVKKATDASSPVPRVPVIYKNVFRHVDVRNKNKKSYGKIDQPFVDGATMLAEGLINDEVVAEHIRWPAGRKRRLVLRIDESNVQPIADGSDITPVVAYLVDAGGAVKRLSDEHIEFSVSGEGKLIGGRKNGINPQKLLWGEAVALVRSTETAGRITIKAKVLNEGINSPSEAEIEFSTKRSNHRLLFDEASLKTNPVVLESLDIERTLEKEQLIKELRILKKELLEYKLNEVGRQQEDFIQ